MHYKILRKLFAVVLLAMLPQLLLGQNKARIKVTGHIKGLRDGLPVTLSLFDSMTQKWVAIDTSIAKNETFVLTANLPAEPRYCWIMFPPYKKIIRAIFSNSENIDIETNPGQEDLINKYPHSVLDEAVTITGSATNRFWLRDQEMLTAYADSIRISNGNTEKIKDSIGFEPVSIEKLLIMREKITKNFAANLSNVLPKNLIPLYIDLYNPFVRSGHSALIRDVFKNLDAKTKESYSAKMLMLNEYFTSEHLAIGDKLAPFELPDTGKKVIALNDLIKRSKVTIVHFWANTSYGRAELDKNLFAVYKHYHLKGLNIIGVSSDKYIEEWKETLGTEKYPWFNVIDKGGNLTTNIYKEGGHNIPNTTDVLLDTEGKIIAWDPSPIELQYYLWKCLGQ